MPEEGAVQVSLTAVLVIAVISWLRPDITRGTVSIVAPDVLI
jgi:hypothetical protein